jgi:ethanolamine ammonia-lyase large subunit
MVAAVSKLMRNQDLILVAKKCEVITRFRNTLGQKGNLSVRLQPNHPLDDERGIAASVLDGLLYGSGDAVIGINPATDSPTTITRLLYLLNGLRERFEIPTQSCVLNHITTTIDLIGQGVPVDLVFQSIAGLKKRMPVLASISLFWRKATRQDCRCSVVHSVLILCILRPARVARFRRMPTTGSTSKHVKLGRMLLPDTTNRYW